MLNLNEIAGRIAGVKKKDPTGITPEEDPDWQKIQSMFDTGFKSVYNDFRQSISDEDSKLTIFNLERMLEFLTKMMKHLKLREGYMKLKETEKKVFD